MTRFPQKVAHRARGKGSTTNLVAVKYFTSDAWNAGWGPTPPRLVTPAHPTVSTAPWGSDAEVALASFLR